MMASQLAPILPPLANQDSNTPPATSGYQSIDEQPLAANATPATSAAKGDQVKKMKLFWSEPITAPDGTAPQVSAGEIKLVEVHGEVSVTPPGAAAQTGTEGMVVPSGSMVSTANNASAALFMGGVNSARLMPNCELVVTQAVSGSIRTDVINLHAGAVFSRVGHRDGETENYSVCTPEGTSDPGVSDMLAFRGTPADLRNISTARTRLALDPTHLFAWDPAPAHGLISDVASSDMGILTPIGNILSTYFYYTGFAGGFRQTLNASQIRTEVLTNLVPNAEPSQSEPDYVLQAILLTLQPFNVKLNQLLNAINKGTETAAQLKYYHCLVTVFFDDQAPGVINDILNRPRGYTRQLDIDSAMLWQDLREFNMNCLTPH